MQEEFDIDPTQFYVFSRDMLRVDVGLVIERPPIFLTMRKRDVEFLKYKNNIMNEYNLNMKQYIEEFDEVSKLNENILADDPYSSQQNLDNFPTHRYKNPETNEVEEYCAASKHFRLVDPKI